MTLHSAGYHPPPTEPAKVRVEINLDVDGVDRGGKIPQWSYHIQVTLADGSDYMWGGTIEAMDDEQAKMRAYSKTVDRLSELLAKYTASKP